MLYVTFFALINEAVMPITHLMKKVKQTDVSKGVIK